MASAKVIIIMGSSSDREHADKIRSRLAEWGIAVEIRVASAHKSAHHLLALLQGYEATGGPRVYITIAGRSNALGGMVDANVSAPVITCPPYSDRFAGADLYSSLRMPGGVSPMVVLEPENAALAAAKIIGLVEPAVQQMVQNLQEEQKIRIIEDDKKLSALSDQQSTQTVEPGRRC